MRAETFEIRWHDTQPIYSCSFQPIAASHLRRVLDHNKAQAAGLEPGKMLADSQPSVSAAGNGSSSSSSATGLNSNGAPSEAGNAPMAAGASSSSSASTTATRQPAIPLSAQGQSWRFATAGGDNHARIWLVHPNIPSPAALAAAAQGGGPVAKHPPRVEYRATLKRHSGVVNCVRFCPKGELLATTGDDGMVLLWIPSDGPPTSFGAAFDDDGDADFAKEHWRLRTMSRASSSEIYDMAWAPSGDSLVIGGTDFVARILHAGDGTVIREISEHNHYIQGVAWDPLSEFIATQSSDRSVHVHQLQGKAPSELTGVQTISRNTKMELGHRRQASNSTHFVWDPNSRPPVKRRSSSHASDSERERDREHLRRNGGRQAQRSSTPMEATGPSTTGPTPSANTPASGPPARAATPTLNQSPAAAAIHSSMNPPQRTPSRRSSFSGSAIGSPPTSATSLAPSQPASLVAGVAGGLQGTGTSASTPAKSHHDRPASGNASRSASRTRGLTPRSPSPAPPLPAIRAPPSPKQRMAAMQASGSGAMARVGMRLYGDENFSGFFRRLNFSPDGALLVTPTGIFESVSTPATNPTHSPASPTLSGHARLSGAGDAASPQSPLVGAHGVAGTSSTPSSAPAGPLRNTVYMYARGNLHRSNAPIAHLPGHKTAALVVKFSPILYELRRDANVARIHHNDDGIPPHPTIPLEAGKQKTVALGSAASAAGGVASSSAVGDDFARGGDESDGGSESKQARPGNVSGGNKSPSTPSMIGLPYRMIFAVATHDSVWIYDTQQGGPLCCFSNMHYASFTDLTWSPDGQTLMMCSTDGYCSGVVFDYGELGTPYSHASQPSLQPGPAFPLIGAMAPAVAKAHGASSPMLRRSSAQSVTSQHTASGVHATPPLPVAASFASGSLSTDTSPALGLGLGTPSLGGGLISDKSGAAAGREIDPPVIPDAAGSTSGNEDQQLQQSRKKRRIAPTLEGPIGS